MIYQFSKAFDILFMTRSIQEQLSGVYINLYGITYFTSLLPIILLTISGLGWGGPILGSSG